MTRPHPLRWLSEQAETGLKELPTNVSWLLSRAEDHSDAASDVKSRVRDRATKLKETVAEATPGAGDSVESRMKHAREQSEHAREAEQRALELAREAGASAERARQVSEQGRTRVNDAKKEGDRGVEERVADAQREAEAQVERARAEARADADEVPA